MCSFDYAPEDLKEEFFELIGRLKAFAAYVNTSEGKYIEKTICAGILGFELEDKE